MIRTYSNKAFVLIGAVNGIFKTKVKISTLNLKIDGTIH